MTHYRSATTSPPYVIRRTIRRNSLSEIFVMTLRSRLLAAFAAFAVVPLLGVGVFDYLRTSAAVQLYLTGRQVLAHPGRVDTWRIDLAYRSRRGPA